MPKTILIQEVYDFLCEWAPLSLAEEWDKVGLQVGGLKKKITGVLVALDITEAVLNEAVRQNANLLITHHPLLYKSEATSRLARLARKKKINILSFHTNLDSTQEGLNDLLANTLGLKHLKPLISSRDKKIKTAGLGRVGQFKKASLKNFILHVTKSLALQHLRYVGDPQQGIQKVAVMTGSGGGYFREAKKAGAHVLVTGDVKYHDALDALAENIALIDVGHYAGEFGMVALVAEKIRQWAHQNNVVLPVFETQVTEDPFRYWRK